MSNYLVITGGSKGIGEQTIAVFLKAGWQVINISRSNCALAGVHNLNIDLSDSLSIEQHRADLIAAIPNADKVCLVHNAAVLEKDNVMTLSGKQLRNVLEVNLVAAVCLNTVFIPTMKMGSSIIYIGTTLAEQAVPNRASYVISKHAVVGLMRSTCQDLAGKGISTCCICPGFVNTKMLTDHVEKSILDNLIKQKVTAQRLIEPIEIAELVYFCAEHPVINGEVIHANLGQVTN